jgi:hypothetical protein
MYQGFTTVPHNHNTFQTMQFGEVLTLYTQAAMLLIDNKGGALFESQSVHQVSSSFARLSLGLPGQPQDRIRQDQDLFPPNPLQFVTYK